MSILVVFGIVLIAGVLYELGILLQQRNIKRRVKSLYRNFNADSTHFSASLPSSLPTPVKRYLQKTLPNNLRKAHSLRIRYSGFFKQSLELKWEKIRGDQYYDCIAPGFVWTGHTRLFTAMDSLIASRGNLSVWFLSAFRIINKGNDSIARAELVRWIAESALFPSSLIPSDKLSWEPVSEHSAVLHYDNNGEDLRFEVKFNSHNEIESLETEREYMNKRTRKWRGKFAGYKHIYNYYIPTELEASWVIDGIEYPYAKFRIRNIEFDKPGLFTLRESA